jgi:DNA anti-recombination protein RmuC
MNFLSPLDDPRLLLMVATTLLAALSALVRRAVGSVEKKIDFNATKVSSLATEVTALSGETKYRIERLARDLEEASRASLDTLAREQERRLTAAEGRMAERAEEIRRHAVTRHEFNLLIANVDAKLEAIFDTVSADGRHRTHR